MKLPSHVFVTGGAAGIGRGVVEALTRKGVSVTTVDLDGAALAALPDAVEAVQGDAHDLDVLALALARGIARFGDLQGAVLNTAAAVYGDVAELSGTQVAHTVAASFVGPRQGFDFLEPHLAAGAPVVFVSSGSAQRGEPGRTLYSAAKAGLEAIVAGSHARHRLRVSAVAPGPTRTAANLAARSARGDADPVAARTPLGRWGEVEDIIGPVLHLLSAEGEPLRGQVVPVDGGLLVRGALYDARPDLMPHRVPPMGGLVDAGCAHEVTQALLASPVSGGAVAVVCPASASEALTDAAAHCAALAASVPDGSALVLLLCPEAPLPDADRPIARAMIGALVRGAATELGERGVRVSALLTRRESGSTAILNSATFLNSAGARWITGAAITVDADAK